MKQESCHQTNKKHEALLAVENREFVIFFKNQRRNTQEKPIGNHRIDLTFSYFRLI
jgi:hypothetical protein